MLFNSISFVIFLIITFSIYWMIPNKFRTVFLFLASCYFYMNWNPIYILLILAVIAISYTAGRLIENNYHKKLVLAGVAVLLFVALFFFKYFDFMCNNVINVFSLFNIHLDSPGLKIILPVGISFYTFQAFGYCVDVYRGQKAEHNFITFATFVSYFPQLVAGPIERTKNLLPQIKKQKEFNYNQATYGLKLMAWGYLKKLCIADVFAVYVDKVFLNYNTAPGFALLFAAFLFSIQIYCDFSGYSDIAIGTSKLFGIDLMTNFKSPYFSKSIKEFWSRWHISLSTWFKDYLYIPLGGNRKGRLKTNINYMIVFLVSGLWHGANWTFIIWGALHGVVQVIENSFAKWSKPKKKNIFVSCLKVFIVFSFCMFAWVFFRAGSFNEAITIIKNSFNNIFHLRSYIIEGLKYLKLSKIDLIIMFFPLLLLGIYDYYSLKYDVIEKISNQKLVVRWIVYVILVLIIVTLMPYKSNAEFIYFQF